MSQKTAEEAFASIKESITNLSNILTEDGKESFADYIASDDSPLMIQINMIEGMLNMEYWLTTLYKINLLFRNGDTGYDEEFSITVASDNSLIGQLFAAVVNQPSNEGVKELLISMMGNSDENESPRYGVLYEEIYKELSYYAYERLGWYDVMVGINSIERGSDILNIREFNPDLIYELELQLSREEALMYFYNL